MIDQDLVEKDLLCYVQYVRAVGERGRNLSDRHVVLCKVRLVKKRERLKGIYTRARRFD